MIGITLYEEARNIAKLKLLIPKLAIVFVIFLLMSALHLWENIVLKIDPFLNSMKNSGLVTFFVIVIALLVVGSVALIVIDIVINFNIIKSSSFMQTRLLFIGVPAALIVLSQFIAICCSVRFSMAKGSFSIAYFAFLYNFVAWIFFYGFMPSKVASFKSAANFNSDDDKNDFATNNNTYDDIDDDDDEEEQPFIQKVLPSIDSP